MPRKSSGHDRERDAASAASRCRSMTTTMPPSSTTEVRIGKKPFMVSVWMANVSAVTR